jgi:hypothetical protein
MVWATAAIALGGCAMPDVDTFRGLDMTRFRPATTAELRSAVTRKISAEDLVDAEGRCAGAAVEPASDPGASQASIPMVPSGIALEMTECDVVKRAGAPERVVIGANDANDRTVVMTYTRGVRPGIYHFTAGRLTLMERAPEPPPPPKPARPAPRKRTT